MRMKRLFPVFAMAVLLGLSACGQPKPSADTGAESASEEAVSVTEEEPVSEVVEEEIEPEVTEEPEEETSAVSETVSEIPEEFVPVEGLSESYTDFDERTFAYDGKIFRLGETTLQDLIDAGLPFNEKELNNINNNVNSNYETDRYNVDINDFTCLQLGFINITEDSVTEKECVLYSARWYTLYVPHADYQDSLNQEIKEKLAECATHICFSFPLTLTKDQLLANSPDPTEQDEFGNVDYKIDSEMYYGTSGFNFKFDKETDQLTNFSMSWLP